MKENKITFKKYFSYKTVTCITAVILLLILCSISFFTGCAKKTPEMTKGASVSVESTEAVSQTTIAESASSSSSTTKEQETTTTATIPQDIKDAIDEADQYYAKGYYIEASSAYRSAKTKINNSSLSEDEKESLIASFEENYDDAVEITNTARMHFGNAMTLQYEKRIEEAVEQLEAAIKIYPKYQDAIDALESIKSIYNLK